MDSCAAGAPARPPAPVKFPLSTAPPASMRCNALSMSGARAPTPPPRLANRAKPLRGLVQSRRDRACLLLLAPTAATCVASRPHELGAPPEERHPDTRKDSRSKFRAKTAKAPEYPRPDT